jgi:threonine aldolase
MYFGSDNQSGASEQVLNAIIEVNAGTSASYGTDAWTQKAERMFCDVFETELKAYFVASGTAANCLALSSLVQPWDQIVCHAHAHILNDELSAPEFYTGGARLTGLGIDAPKLQLETLSGYLDTFEGHEPHTPMPKALSITQLSESGCAYTLEELRGLTSIAKKHNMHVHMDGARFANALVTLGCSPADMTWKSGVDVLCLGASKNGALAAEAVIFFNQDLAKDFEFRRKRAGHLLSKGRLLGSQFCGWLENDHWLDLARQSNAQAAKLAAGIEQSPNSELAWPEQQANFGNEVFALIDNQKIKELRDAGAIFGEWPERFLPNKKVEGATLVRLVVSFNSTDAEVSQFLNILG